MVKQCKVKQREVQTMFDIKVLEKYNIAKNSLAAIEIIRGFYKEMWNEADKAKDDSILDDAEERLAALDVMQVELEDILNGYMEYLLQ